MIRNLQITQCYAELSAVFAGRIGLSANWCTFATWASKQAGQTIRKEDLERLFERCLRSDPAMLQASTDVTASAGLAGAPPVESVQALAFEAGNYSTVIARASEAVGRGNKKVFEEIGREFARFFHTCLHDEAPDLEKLSRFCEELRPGEPPQGQSHLRQAFTYYYMFMFESEAKKRAELLLLANIEIGFHEQTRLQPEIAESMDAGLISALEFTRKIIVCLFPSNSWFKLADLYFHRLIGRPTPLDLAIRTMLEAVRAVLRKTITELMMTISLPSGVVLRLGKDLEVGFPPLLRRIENPDLRQLLEKLDPTPDSVLDSGAVDWADLPDRLHFILDLFRCYQEHSVLFEPPFTPEQVAALKAGRLPEGRL